MSEKFKRILSIDDDPSFNLLLKKYFKSSPYKLTSTETVESFLKEYLKEKPSLCILDINLAEKSGAGYNLLELIKSKIDKKIPILVVSRRSTTEDIDKTLKMGANDFLAKPLDTFHLFQKIQNLIGDEQEESSCPLFYMAEDNKACDINIKMSILKLSEEKILLTSKQCVTKGTGLHIGGSTLKELSGRDSFFTYITDSTKSSKTDSYNIEIAVPEERDIRTSIRKYIKEKKTVKLNQNILLVDDDPMYRKFLNKMILGISKEYSIQSADGVAKAIEKINTSKINYVICDYDMEDGTGVDVFSFIDKNSLKIPFLLVSSLDYERIESNGLISKESFQNKPLSKDYLRKFLLA